jgi:hypothetical protein
MTVNKTAIVAFFLLFSVVPSSAQTQSKLFNHASSYVGLHERSNRTQIKTVTS